MNKHSCGGKTCAFCRALDRHWEKRAGETRMRPDEKLVTRSWEVQSSIHLEMTRATLASADLEEMETYVLLDRLTGLYNSRTLKRELSQEIQRIQRSKKPLSICMVAIDGLDQYLKSNGALAGDSLLKVVASAMKKTIREIDLACRYTSERFAIILPETGPDGAKIAAERIRRSTMASLSSNYGTYNEFSVSVAIASYPVHARKPDELLEQASKALSFAMIQGGSYVGQAAAVF